MMVIVSKRPNCKECGRPLKSWNPWVEEHECTDCLTTGFAEAMIKSLKSELEIKARVSQDNEQLTETKP